MHNDQPAQPTPAAATTEDGFDFALFQALLQTVSAHPLPPHCTLNVLATLYRSIVLQLPEQHGGALAFCSLLASELLNAAGQQVQAAQGLQGVQVLGSIPGPASSNTH